MNENVKERKKNNYLPILIGVIVLIVITVAIAVGYFFIGKTPDKIFEGSIHQIADELIKKIDDVDDVDFSKDDITLNGTVKFDTSIDLGDAEFLKNYSYNIKNIYQFPKKS